MELYKGINEIKETSNNITNEINSIGFDWEDFISTAIGFVGSEIISIGAILLFAGVIFASPELMMVGFSIYFSGILLLAIADGVNSENATSIDYGFFYFDIFVSSVLPFIGGDIKLSENIIKESAKKVSVYYACKPIFQRVYVTFEKNFVQFGLKDLIVENLYNAPFIEKIKDVAKWDVFPSFVQEIIDDNLNFNLR